MSSTPRKRRRVQKRSTAPDYDRSMDAPGAQVIQGTDEIRTVPLDDSDDQPTNGIDYFLEQRPPHHGE
ncbi:hypothetical protein QP027_03210 [Corynebacterium breve]|uniref:Uncharacterized protein n=1 Tax=Corynebacterium breve TaxID=3049799 RepID=A0ABY8VLJ0_9CORY|nr:hypothetical protein [Corynebacterium breve]WIM68420.1 hypothetical protein QP027_03210 [Corynebacterium breve]